MSRISSGEGWRDCTPSPSGPIEPAMSTSRAADSRASRAILTPRLLKRVVSSARPWGASLKRFAPKVLVSMICAPASIYAWCTRKTASGCVTFSSSKQRCDPATSCNIEPIAPSAIRTESASRALRSSIFIGFGSSLQASICLGKKRKSISLRWRTFGKDDGRRLPTREPVSADPDSSCHRKAVPTAARSRPFGGALLSPRLFHQPGDGAHQIVFGEDLIVGVVHFDEHGRAFVAQKVGDALHGSFPRHLRQRLAHDLADHHLAQVFALQREVQNLVFVDGTDGSAILEDRELGNVLFLHGAQGVEDGLVRPRNNQLAHLACLVLYTHHIPSGQRHFGLHISALAHPLVAVHLAEVAHAGVGQERYHHVGGFALLRHAQRSPNAAAARAAGKDALLLGQATRPGEALLVGHLHHVVQHLKSIVLGKKSSPIPSTTYVLA